MTAHLTVFQGDLARRLRSQGKSLRDIAKEIGCSHSGVDVMLRGQPRPGKADARTPRKGVLCANEREDISHGISSGDSMSQIFRQISFDRNKRDKGQWRT